MKIRFGITLMFVVAISALWIFSQRPLPSTVKIEMTSNPFPLVLGQTNLMIAVTQGEGTPLDAEVTVAANMMMEGMLPVNMQKTIYKNGLYQVPIIWPMAGQWMVDVTAKRDGEETGVTESFEVYVYPTAMDNGGGLTQFRSASENLAFDTDPTHQMVIVIPQGTRELMLAGQAPDVIPSEVHLNVNGQNTLVIQNDDIVDHTIGPYMVHAGETLRQTFTRPATYQGKCSANVRATVNIIVDE